MSGRQFQKGQSGNPGGRPKSDYAIKDLAQKKCPAALKRLEEIAKQSEDLRAAVAACMGILAYGVGKPAQRVDITNSDGSLSAVWQSAMRELDGAVPTEQAEATVQH